VGGSIGLASLQLEESTYSHGYKYIRILVHSYIYTYMYIYIYLCIHIYIYKYMSVPMWLCQAAHHSSEGIRTRPRQLGKAYISCYIHISCRYIFIVDYDFSLHSSILR
jgi:hypothetical protein